MTDKEIIKALEYCKDCSANLNTEIVELIVSQQKEIERLEEESSDKERAYTDEYCLRKEWQDKCRQLLIEKQTAKSEAVKEFAERLKEKSFKTIRNYGLTKDVVEVCDIDNLVKEMVGEKE